MQRKALQLVLLGSLLVGLCGLWAGPAVALPVPQAPDTMGAVGYTLQIATFADKAKAEHMLEALPEAWIQEIRKEGTLLYRVNYKRFDTRTEAIRAQWDLEDRGYQSFIQQLYS